MTEQVYAGLGADDSGQDGSRPPIVLVHGLTFDRNIWAPVLAAFRQHDSQRRVIAFDLPGHGASPSDLPHDMPRVADLVHDAVSAAGVDAPVLVGHSMSGGLVSVYAARYPAAGVINVDQAPVLEPFGQLLRTLEPQLRSAAFDQIWQQVFAASFHLELLPSPARNLVESNSRPSQDLVLSYWQTVLDRPTEEFQSIVDDSLVQIGRRGLPYVLVLGGELPAEVRDRLRGLLPDVRILDWPGTGHFPHLARPGEFAELLAATASWPAAH